MLVDGMDVLAVYAATQEAVGGPPSGEGPTLIEAVCYRFGAHATADDARLYRHADRGGGVEAAGPDRPAAPPSWRAPGSGHDELDGAVRTEAARRTRPGHEAIEDRPLPGGTSHPPRLGPGPRPPSSSSSTRLSGVRGEEETEFAAERDLGDRRGLRSPRGRPSAGRWPRRSTPPCARGWSGRVGDGAARRGRRARRRRLPDHRGSPGRFGEDRVIDTPLNESGIVGDRHRDGRRRGPGDRRDPVRRVRLPRLRPDRQPPRPDPLPEQGPRRDAGGGADAQRGGDRRPRAPLRLARGVLRPRPRVDRCGARRPRSMPRGCSPPPSRPTTR